MRTVTFASLATMTLAFAVTGAWAQDAAPEASVLQDRRIGYVLTSFHWAVQASEQKTECPKGFNDGPREQYTVLYPKDTKRTVIGSNLVRESQTWFPSLETDQFDAQYKEPVSKIAPGLNLDSKSDGQDFVSPDGEAGIDNQLYRVVGCTEDYRPGGTLTHFTNFYMRTRNYPRFVIELTDVDSLVNDDDVTVTTYRGLDPLPLDATGNGNAPYGTQRIDLRWGKMFNYTLKGKIVDGVLITNASDIKIPYNYAFNDRGVMAMRGAQLKLNLTSEQATGLYAGFFDTWSWYRALNGALGTHSLSYGRQSAPSMWRALNRLADGYPDPKTGRNTAISGAITVTMKQAFIQHPDAAVAATAGSQQKQASIPGIPQPASR